MPLCFVSAYHSPILPLTQLHCSHLPLQVDSPDSLENVESKWVGEIAENCPGVRLVLVALKCDLREQQTDDDDPATSHEPKRAMIDYKQGLAVAEKIKALRYLGKSPLHYIQREVASRPSSMNDTSARLRRPSGCNANMRPECSAMKNRGVNEAFTEAARVALQVKNVKGDKDSSCTVM